MRKIRPMQPEDLPEVMRIEGLAFSEPWPEEAFQATSHADSWVLGDDFILLGYIIYHTVLDESVIINFAIDPVCQRQGLGTMLLEQTMALMARRGIQVFFLDVRASNEAALNLYRKFGFCRVGLRKDYYSHPDEDAVVMVKHVGGV